MGYGGRPPKYKTAEEMQAAIDAYFESCKGEPIIGGDGQPIMDKYGNVILIHATDGHGAGARAGLYLAARPAQLSG